VVARPGSGSARSEARPGGGDLVILQWTAFRKVGMGFPTTPQLFPIFFGGSNRKNT